MSATHNALGDAFRAIASGTERAFEWERLVREAREANVLGVLGHRLDACERLAHVPDAPRAHFVSARTLAAAQARAVRREVRELHHALAGLVIPVVLLKGAAYAMAGLPPADGRTFADIDVLVPESALPHVESALMLAGFAMMHKHPYDQHYFRRWAHELPPMQHIKRMTVVDVHHAIVPRTARLKPDSEALIRASVPLPAPPGFRVLAPPDMLLHSATHLFNDEELSHGPRDLVDIDALARHFGADE